MPKMLEDTSIDRYTAVAKVLAKVAGGMTLSRAIRVVSKAPVLCRRAATWGLVLMALEKC